MQYRELGRTGWKVSTISFGAWAIGGAWGEVEERLKVMGPYDFQNLVAGLLRGMGYHVAWVAPRGLSGRRRA